MQDNARFLLGLCKEKEEKRRKNKVKSYNFDFSKDDLYMPSQTSVILHNIRTCRLDFIFGKQWSDLNIKRAHNAVSEEMTNKCQWSNIRIKWYQILQECVITTNELIYLRKNIYCLFLIQWRKCIKTRIYRSVNFLVLKGREL